MSEELLRLSATADTVDLRKVGKISISKPKYISGKLMAHYCRTVAAQALLDNLVSTCEGLLIRNTMPTIDLVDGYGETISDRIWIQPANNVTYDQSDYSGYQLYKTNRDVLNDRKVHLFYGILDMRPDLPLYATKLRFTRHDVRTIDIIDLTTLKHYNDVCFFQQPILCRRSDNTRILVDLGPDARGHNDHLAFLGITAEPLGQLVV